MSERNVSLKSVCASEVELFIVSQHFAAAPFANGNCSEKTFSWRNIGFSVWPVPFHESIHPYIQFASFAGSPGTNCPG